MSYYSTVKNQVNNEKLYVTMFLIYFKLQSVLDEVMHMLDYKAACSY